MAITKEIIKYNLKNLPQIVFEVTDACNLHCKYCGYSDLYLGYDNRTNKFMSFEMAKNILDYLIPLWKLNNHNNNVINPISIGFYGGEPLLNVPLIEKIIKYVNEQNGLGKKFIFNMTTNALLLDKYADFLSKHEFRLMISLDGDEYNHSYRVDHQGKNSFNRVIENVRFLQNNYPEYFSRFVTFNAVLHNRNSVQSIYNFIKQNFQKEPNISPLNATGVRPEQQEEFNRTYKNYAESINSACNCESFKREIFIKNPETRALLEYLHRQSGNVYANYNSLMFNNNQPLQHTGTCLPFQKKMFVTVNGKILTCERIHHEFAMGQVDENGVTMDFEQIASNFNNLIEKVGRQCDKCADRNNCSNCLYQIDDINTLSHPSCNRLASASLAKKRLDQLYLYLKKHPDLYLEVLKKAVLRS